MPRVLARGVYAGLELRIEPRRYAGRPTPCCGQFTQVETVKRYLKGRKTDSGESGNLNDRARYLS